MKPFRLYSRALILTYGLVASLFYSQSEAAVAPAEQASVQIVRTATSQVPLSFSLSKNVMKTETYDSEYTVQVPYEATETYTEQVPYQTTETYTEQVPYTTQVPYTDYETDYRNENVCHDHTVYRNECHNEQKCYIVPGNGGGNQCRPVTECGTNAQGQQICKTREVCDGGGDSGPAQRCDNQQVCNQVPTNEQQCGYEQVAYQRQVTKYRTETQYRSETRTREVTRYRDEQRTRTVTKYRTETKCCVSKTREVFDHQLQYQVSVAIPAEAVLAANESEKLQFKLVSTEPAVVEMTTLSSSYRYKIVNQSVSGASVLIELAVLPKYDLSNVGPSVISGMKLDYSTSADRFQVTFVDSLKSDEIKSGYFIVVTDDKGNVIEQLAANGLDSAGKSVTRIKTSLAKNLKLTATLKVFRISAKLADGSLNFDVVIKN